MDGLSNILGRSEILMRIDDRRLSDPELGNLGFGMLRYVLVYCGIAVMCESQFVLVVDLGV